MPLLSSELTKSQLRLTWEVEATVATVWENLTTTSSLSQWLGEVVAGEVLSGRWFIVDHGDGYRCESTVLAHAPCRALVYSWKFPDEPRTEVSWALSHTGGSTCVQLTHTGLTDMVMSYRDGWITHLTFLEASVLGVPLPATMFWHIHATIACLNAAD